MPVEGLKFHTSGLEVSKGFAALAAKAREEATKRRESAENTSREHMKAFKIAEAQFLDETADYYEEMSRRANQSETYLLGAEELTALTIIKRPDPTPVQKAAEAVDRVESNSGRRS